MDPSRLLLQRVDIPPDEGGALEVLDRGMLTAFGRTRAGYRPKTIQIPELRYDYNKHTVVNWLNRPTMCGSSEVQGDSRWNFLPVLGQCRQAHGS